MCTITPTGLPGLDLPHHGVRPTITEQLHAFDSQHSWVYRALEQLVSSSASRPARHGSA